MGRDEPGDESNIGRLLFGAGFAFGVMFTLLVLGTVTAGLGSSGVTPKVPILRIIAVSVLLTGIIGSATYLLSLPENRLTVPVSLALGANDPDDE
jgi:hypothetical protein